MMLKTLGISRSIAAVAVLAAALGCNTDSSKSPSSQLASPVTPLQGNSVTISSSRTTLQVGTDDVFAVLSVQALRNSDFSPLPDGTDVVLSANLGAFDSAGGARAVTIDLVGGRASANFYPGTTAGSARVTATVNGVIAQVSITIKEDPTGGLPPEPAPVQSTLTLQATPGFVSVADAASDALPTTDVLFEATVLGSDGKPFRGAGVFFTSSSGLGTFSSGTATSAIFKTNSVGKVSDILAITDAEMAAFPNSSFTVVGHLGIVGGERTASISVTVIAGPAPPTATKITLQASTSFVNDDGGGASIDLDALVQDQFGAPFAGGNVTFKSTLGSPSPVIDTSDGTGNADSTLTLSGAQIASHPTNSFSLTAELTTATGTVISAPPIVITIVRSPTTTPTSVQILASKPTVIHGGAGDAVDFDAIVRDQNGNPLAGVTVTFSKTGPGSFSGGGTDVSDGGGLAETTLTISDAELDSFPGNSFTVTATIGVSGGTASSSVAISIVRPPVANFTWSGSSGSTTVNFVDTSSGNPTSWAWDFDAPTGDDAFVQNPSAVDLSLCVSPCAVKLTATNAAGSSSITKGVTLPLP